MEPHPTLFYFDFVDPLSYLVHREIRTLSPAPAVRWVPAELRAPPASLLDPEGDAWTDRWTRAVDEAPPDVGWVEPMLVPWSRKAHELTLHAEAEGAGDEARDALFSAFFLDGRDIGRVDVLVELARGLGLDPTEAKAVLDVDRWARGVVELGKEAAAAGVADTPTLLRGSRRHQGFHSGDAVRTFLLR